MYFRNDGKEGTFCPLLPAAGEMKIAIVSEWNRSLKPFVNVHQYTENICIYIQTYKACGLGET